MKDVTPRATTPTPSVSAARRGEIHCTKANFNFLLYPHAIKFK